MRRSLALLALLSPGCGGTVRDTARPRLRHPDAAERRAALAEMDLEPRRLDRPAVLHAALSDPDPGVRRDAALLLEARAGTPLEQAALESLGGDRPDPEAAEALLGDRREALRAAAVAALGRLGTPRAWALLADRMSEEPSPGLRAHCARGVAEGAARGAGPFHGRLLDALRRGLEDDSPEVRLTCARALAAAGDAAGAGILAEALSASEGSPRAELAALLRTATGEDLGEDAGPWMDRYGARR